MRVFLGITGASGAPYARRLLQSLAAADCEVGVSISGAAIEVLATELYGDARLSRDETVARFTEGTGENVTVFEPNDWKAPYASGSAKVDAYVICPCSMGTLGTIASGAMQNLIHRAASVALKEERKLVLCPRETPLSAIHLENMLTLKRAGATILFLAPGFYHGADSVDDLVDFVVARCSTSLASRTHSSRVGGPLDPRARRRPHDVRPHRAGVRRHEPRDDGGARRALAAAGRGGGRPTRRRRARRRVRHGRPRACRSEGGCGAHDRSRLLRAHARARAPQEHQIDWVRGDLLALPFDDGSFDAATVGFGVRNVADLERALAELRRVLRPGGRLAILEITRPRGILRPFFSLWFDRIVPLLGKVLPGGSAYTYLPASVKRFPDAEALAELMRGHGFGDVRFRLLGGSIVALHTGAVTE